MIELQHAEYPLKAEMAVPGDKSISHRAVMFGSLAKGDTRITGFLNGADCLSTIRCFRKLGVKIDIEEGKDEDSSTVIVHGQGLHGLSSAEKEICLDTGNSGTTTRILSGILAPQPFVSILSGDASVNSRPMARIMDPLSEMGAHIESVRGNGCAPLRISGTALHGCAWHSPVASAQVKSAILCAGLFADSPTTVIEPALSRDHTERMLTAFGAKIMSIRMPDGCHAGISPADELYAQEIDVPGDISSAAYFIVAALLVPGSELIIHNVDVNPTRDGIIRVLQDMGADITLQNRHGGIVGGIAQQGLMPSSHYGGAPRSEGPEPAADLIVKYSPLHGTTVCGEIIPALIDELPVLAVAAAAASGVTFVKDAAELKVKECDRITAMAEGLNAMGADVAPTPDGWVINGIAGKKKALRGADIACRADHRIAMSFAVASLIAEGTTRLDDDACVRISYPGFFRDFAELTKP
jgi:3-phosphoshikimate 1-carboxyvinyltransferase